MDTSGEQSRLNCVLFLYGCWSAHLLDEHVFIKKLIQARQNIEGARVLSRGWVPPCPPPQPLMKLYLRYRFLVGGGVSESGGGQRKMESLGVLMAAGFTHCRLLIVRSCPSSPVYGKHTPTCMQLTHTYSLAVFLHCTHTHCIHRCGRLCEVEKICALEVNFFPASQHYTLGL